MKYFIHFSLTIFFIGFMLASKAQTTITGTVTSQGKPVEQASVMIVETGAGTVTNAAGLYNLIIEGNGIYHLKISCIGYESFEKNIQVKGESEIKVDIILSDKVAGLDEVVVTGVLKGSLVKENPVAIVTVPLKKIEQANESNIIDVLVKSVPGLNVVKTGPNVSKPFIRGLGYNRVLTLYDGIRQEGQQWGDEHSVEVDAYNIEKAEVIKGPASLMYGSDAVAGVLSLYPFIPKTTDKKLHGRLITEYQSNNNLIGNGLQMNYANDHFLFSVNGSHRFAKNYRNSVDGRVYNTGFKETNFSTLVGYKTAAGYSHVTYTLYDNLQGIPDGSRDSLSRKFTYQIYEADNDILTERPIVTEEVLNAYQLSTLHQHIKHQRLYTHHFYKIGTGNIDVLAGFQQNIRKEFNHPTLPEQAGMFVRLNTVNYGLRYNAPKFSNIETAIGINGMLQNNKSIDATSFPIPDYKLKDGGLYVYAKWKYNKLSISGGARYDVRQVQWNDFYIGKNTTTGFDRHITGSDTAGEKLQFPAYSKTFNGLSASIGFTLQLSKQINLKANIGRGYRSPNITEMASNGLDPGAHIIYLGNRNFNPEFSLQEDIGVSFMYKDFSAEVNVFNNNIRNYIYLTMLVDANGEAITDAQGNKTYQYQQASAQLYGMEMSFALHPQRMKGFTFNNSISAVYGLNRKEDVKDAGLMGEYLPLIPPFKLLSMLTQKFEIRSNAIKDITPKVELEYSAAQNRYMALNNTETFTPNYTLLNAGVSATFRYSKNHDLQFYLQVNNIFNAVYQSHLSRLKYFEYYNDSPNGRTGMYNMGRNICLKLIAAF